MSERRLSRSLRWFVLFLLPFLGMMACGLPGSIGPGGEATVAEPTSVAAPELAQPTSTLVVASVEASVPTASRPTSTTVVASEETLTPTATRPPDAAIPPETATIAPEASPTTPIASVETVAPPPRKINVAFILDASGSMLEALDGRTRLAVAQDAIADLSAGLSADVEASLTVFGSEVPDTDKTASCKDVREVIPLGPVDPAEFDAVAHSFGAKGYTPITRAIRRAAASLPSGEGERNSIVVVSDGEETCDRDPCAAAAELHASDIKVTMHIVGFAATKAARTQLRCMADVTGGTYHDADDAEELGRALDEAIDAAAEVASGDVEGLGSPTSVAVSPDGRHIYVTAAGTEAVVVFGRDPTTGRLTFIEVHKNGVDGVVKMDSPLGLAISPDGRHVYVSGGDDLTVAIFSREPSTGGLTFLEAQDVFAGVAGVDIVQSVTVSPDNTSVYVTGADWYDTGEPSRPADAVAVFGRDPGTGRLTLVEVHQNGAGGVEGLKDVTGVAVSPDNKNVYAVNTGRTLVAFSRDMATGRMIYVETQEDGVDGVAGLLGANEVVVSPDAEHLYVASGRGGAVAVFDRDPATGELIFVEAMTGSAGGSAADLAGTSGLAVSPDGGHVYLVTENSDKLHVMERNTATGALTYVATLTDDVDGVDGLEGAQSVTVSPDNAHVYVASLYDNSVAVLYRDLATGELVFVEVVRNTED